MIVFTAKVSVKKIALGLAALCAVLWGVHALTPHATQSVAANTNEIAQKLETNDQRIAYLRSFGWDPSSAPSVEMEVQIPKKFDEAYTEYNALQQRQGLDLSKYRGKRVMLYSYPLKNYPCDAKDVTASLVLYKNRVIAADVSSSETNGFTHGIAEHPPTQTTAPKDTKSPSKENSNTQLQNDSPTPNIKPDNTSLPSTP